LLAGRRSSRERLSHGLVRRIDAAAQEAEAPLVSLERG
jgi:hypothetical protein